MTLSPDNNRRGPLDTVYVGHIDPQYGARVVADGMTMDWPADQFGHPVFCESLAWGDRTRGCAALAWALLNSATRQNAACANDLYRLYLRDVVSKWDKDYFVTTRACILRWIGEQPGHLDGRESAEEGEVSL